MATIGHLSAVTDAFGMRFTGVTGYTMWGFVHVLYLIGWGNRVAAVKTGTQVQRLQHQIAGPIDWVHCPAEFLVATCGARRAVTSHDVLQTLQFESARNGRELLGRVFEQAHLILSVSRFNTDRLLEAYPACKGCVAYVPNGADDCSSSPQQNANATPSATIWDCRLNIPYLLSVANFQPET